MYAKKYEVILVNDGSRDNTLSIARELEKENRNIRVVSQKNQGYGGAVKRGFKEAKYKWVFYSDGDLQFDLSEFKRFIPFTEKYDMVIGYRKIRAEGFRRFLVAKMLRIWNLLFLGFPLFIKDIDCAFKLINRDVINAVKPLESNGAMLTTEFLLKAHRKGFKIKQVGVKHYRRLLGVSSGNNLKVIIKAIKDTFIIRDIMTQKKYITTIRPAIA